MSAQVPGNVPAAKGAVCYCLDEFSTGPGARARVGNLSDAISALPPNYAGLAETFDQYLLKFEFSNPSTRQDIVDHLNMYWFDPASPQTYFPGVPVAKIYAQGVLQALKLSLGGMGPVVPLNSWWVLDAPDVEMIAMADQENGVTVSGSVTLLIQTPRPKQIRGVDPKPPWILGNTAEAYVTRREGRQVATRRVRNIR
jgi:hypothetical protein